MAPTIAPYGSWRSSITVDALLVDRIIAHEPRIDGQTIAWLEGRPSERGRSVVVRASESGGVEELTPAGSDVHDGVHEYGGGAWAIDDGVVYYSERSDDRLYRIAVGAAVGWRDARGHHAGRRHAFRGLHHRPPSLAPDRRPRGRIAADGPPTNDVVAIPLGPAGADPAEPIVLVSGADFYGPLALSPDGDRLAWLTWQLPDMPWDGSELWVADLDAEGRPTGARRVAGSRSESIAEPRWSPDGRLHFVSDRTDWWNLYRREADRSITALAPLETEFAGPQWVFGLSTYGFADDGSIVAVSHDHATDRLWRIPPDGAPRAIALPYLEISGLAVAGDRIVIVAGRPSEPDHVVAITDDGQGAAIEILRRTSPGRLRPRHRRHPRADRLPDRGWPDRARTLLPTDQPRLRRARPTSGRRSSCAAMAARPPAPGRASSAASSTSSAAASPSSTSTTAAAPAMAAPTVRGSTASGAWSTWTTASTPAATWPRSARWTRLAWPARAAAPAAIRRWPCSPSGPVPWPPGSATSASAT